MVHGVATFGEPQGVAAWATAEVGHHCRGGRQPFLSISTER
jgi:hypothetical protein